MTKRAIFHPARRGGKNWAAGPNGGTKPKKAKRAPKPRPDPKPVHDLLVPVDPGTRVIVPFPPAELSPNWRGHWSKKSPVARNYRRLCWALALEAKFMMFGGLRVITPAPIALRLDFFPPDRSSRDDDNVIASFKAGRDGIADALRVDDSRFVTTSILHREPRSCVVVTLIAPRGAQGEGDVA